MASAPSPNPGGRPGSDVSSELPGIIYIGRLAPSGAFHFDFPLAGAEDFLELTPAEVSAAMAGGTLSFLPDEGPDLLASIHRSAAELTPWSREVRFVAPRSGRERRLRIHSTPRREADGSVVWTGLAFDVTDLRATEHQLRRAYQELSFHVDNTPLAVLEWDHEFRLARWTGQAERVFGWAAVEVVGKRPFEWRFIHEEDFGKIEECMREIIAGRKTRFVMTNRYYTKSGALICCELHNSVLHDDRGGIVSILSLMLDVTERMAAEEALARSETQLRAALDGARMFAWDLDLVTGLASYSTDFAAFFGLPSGPDYTISENAWRAVHPDDAAGVTAAIEEAKEPGRKLVYEFRGRVLAADGGPRWFAASGQVARGPDGTPIRLVAVTTDVTDRKRAEQEREALDRQLEDAQRWESLGVLAGGVAHDFNNILTVILGCAGLARRDLTTGSAGAAGHLAQIEQASRRAADLCRQLLAYAGRSQVTTAQADLNQVIRESAALLEVPAAKPARVRFDLAPTLPFIEADPGQVRQVLLNLTMNAAEALSQVDDEVVVRTGTVEVGDGPPDPNYQLAPLPGWYVRLEVTDTGSGIPPDVRARMFDPFFSTKFAGRGLGLAAVLGIVRTHKGAIRVDSVVGRGTTVHVLWRTTAAPTPVTGPAPTTDPAESAGVRTPAPTPPTQTPAALIVDDEMYVREVAASTLQDLGYNPLLAGDGPSGLELFRRHRAAIRVAVIDVVMPGMTGEQLYEALRGIDPALAVVLISGYTERRLTMPPKGGRVEFLQKPFHPEDLAKAIERVVGTAR